MEEKNINNQEQEFKSTYENKKRKVGKITS